MTMKIITNEEISSCAGGFILEIAEQLIKQAVPVACFCVSEGSGHVPLHAGSWMNAVVRNECYRACCIELSNYIPKITHTLIATADDIDDEDNHIDQC